ncbi:hypothetical protein [Variovorax sp. JS1663]|nr:hypothetical protein [Variovorax sp. JS1663]
MKIVDGPPTVTIPLNGDIFPSADVGGLATPDSVVLAMLTISLQKA